MRARTRSSVDFDAFFEETWPELVAFCRTLTHDASTAEEITQETLVRVYARFPLLDDPRPYAFRVAANLVRRSWRSAQRLQVTDPAGLPDQAGPTRSTETLDAVRRLPPRLRDVVLLHYYADLPVDTVATQLRRPVGTVKRRLHEARRLLAAALDEEI